MPASLVLGPMLRFVSEREAVFWVETDRDCQVEVLGASERTFRVHDHHYALKKDQDERGREVDSLRALSHRMRGHGPDDWPDVLLLLGDQVYADEVSPVTSAFIEQRRDSDEEPGERVVDYEEYTRLYHEAWSEPSIRWLLSVVSSAMIFDDHDVHDDWNTSAAWVEEARKHHWWNEHIVAALISWR